MKKNQSKTFIKTICITLIAFLLTSNSACAMSKKISNSNPNQVQEEKLFSFDNYKTTKSLVDALSQIYPVGSDSNKMIEDMEKFGARCVRIGEPGFRGRNRTASENLIICELPKKEKGFLYQFDWSIYIYKKNDNSIKTIAVDKKYFGV